MNNTITARISTEDKKKLKKIAHDHKTRMSSINRILIRDFLDDYHKLTAAEMVEIKARLKEERTKENTKRY